MLVVEHAEIVGKDGPVNIKNKYLETIQAIHSSRNSSVGRASDCKSVGRGFKSLLRDLNHLYFHTVLRYEYDKDYNRHLSL